MGHIGHPARSMGRPMGHLGRPVGRLRRPLGDVYKCSSQHLTNVPHKRMTYTHNCQFAQNPAMRPQRLGTWNKKLIEASPFDAVWGIEAQMTLPHSSPT